MSTILNYCSSLFSKNEPDEATKQAAAAQKEYRKFVELGFPHAICSSHPECVHFLLSSGVAFAIAMFKNSTQSGMEQHGVRISADGHPLIKMEGEWQRWDHISSLVEFDRTTGRVISKGQPALGWNYISPDGLVQKDIYTYGELYPVEQLSPEEYQKLRSHAEKFWDTNDEVDPSEEKECIVQIVSTTR
ncbi:MAG: hypothetical protein JSR46_08235, partial [Verrucomicrobia bacterium]|nr:hypothetical protein [Verrucomicrobiota bacterium]